MHTSTLRVGFVPGVEPDRFLQRWKAARRSAYLELVPVPLSAQQTALAEGEVDMCFVRLPLEAEDLHLVPLWEERAAVVVATRTCSACSRRSAPMTSRARPRSRR